ncbi:MAG TPA: Gfo/Idh/MocA family oxidoreductase [Verrucomicrobiales bacterium]|nr:Gfo/Idh/MocA family oxidoreductase [Verrucomicrobiales bacterium]
MSKLSKPLSIRVDPPKSGANSHRKRQGVSRRSFISKTLAVGSAVALPQFIPAKALGRDGAVAPSERIVLGGIGLGPRGRYDLSVMLPEKDVQFVTICDVQRSRREIVKNMADTHYGNKDCTMGRDMFEVLERPDIDAVLIATGDHWHALASILAMKAGKDVYSEKPCGMTIAEVQAVCDAANRYGRVYQAGTQRRSLVNFQYAVHLAQSGFLGQIHTMHASVYTPSRRYDWLPAEPEPPKDECDWDRWLGPSPWRPYNKEYISGRWRGHYDFEGAANFPDWGAHTVDLCQWANGADDTMPIEYESDSKGIYGKYANGVKLICDFLPTPFGNREPHYRTSTGTCPVRYEGDEGWVETGDNGEIALSENLVKTLGKHFVKPGTSAKGHGRNFFDCVKSRARTVCNQNVMRHSHISCFAAELAWELDRKIFLDPVKEKFVSDDEANRRIRRATREPWSFHV